MALGLSLRPQLILASASARRRELLNQIGVRFETLPVDISEAWRAGELPQVYVQRIALEKARGGWDRSGRDLPVLGADTIIELNGEVVGKPADRAQALAILEALSGREHRVYSGVAIIASVRCAQRASCTRVCFRNISLEERRAYWASGEPLGKAGGYAIQGKGAVFVKELHGSYSGVVGLPLFETAELLREFGIPML
jgi:septum formation protein